jgi:hypothetical protein
VYWDGSFLLKHCPATGKDGNNLITKKRKVLELEENNNKEERGKHKQFKITWSLKIKLCFKRDREEL